MSDIFSSVPTLIFMPFFATLFILMSKKEQASNIYNVCWLAIIANMILVLRFFYLIDTSSNSLQLVVEHKWLEYLDIHFVFGVDIFSLLLILAIHLAFFIILSGIKYHTEHPKTLATFAMLFLSMMTGLLISNDLFSFYLFFEALLIPLYLLIGVGGGIKKQEKINTFFLYNIFFSFLFFAAIVLLFNNYHNSYIISNIKNITLNSKASYFVWIAVLLSLLSRLPIWPFHRMQSLMNSDIKNPLVFFASNLMPITAIYGFIRILPHDLDANMQYIINILQILAIISAAFIALISFAHKDFQYKIFSCISIIYLFYLMAVFSNTIGIAINISLSFFAFILALAGIEIIYKQYIDNEQGLSVGNKKILKFLLFCLLSFPLSSAFLNNFAMLGYLYQYNPIISFIIFASITLSGYAIIEEMMTIKTTGSKEKTPKILLFICFLLIMSFIKPFWFVEL